MSKIQKNVHMIQVPSLEYDKEYWKDIVFEWIDSKSLVENEQGELVEAGTCLRLRNKIELLSHLTDEQLNSLQIAVVEAVAHELSKRK